MNMYSHKLIAIMVVVTVMITRAMIMEITNYAAPKAIKLTRYVAHTFSFMH